MFLNIYQTEEGEKKKEITSEAAQFKLISQTY